MKNVVIDMETLGLPPNGVVLSIGASYFDDEEFTDMDVSDITVDTFRRRGISLKLDVDDQRKNYGRTIDDGVVSWWRKQSDEAKTILRRSPNDLLLADAVESLFDWVGDDDVRFWARGINFDLTLLESLMTNVGYSRKMGFWNYRDIRSFIAGVMMDPNYDRVGVSLSQIEHGYVAHDALSDVSKDIVMIMMAPRYASGLDLPEDPHPDTVPKVR